MEPTLLFGTGLFILGAVVWIVCIVQANKLARKRHRSVGGWTALAVFLGPLAYFALYVLPPGR